MEWRRLGQARLEHEIQMQWTLEYNAHRVIGRHPKQQVTTREAGSVVRRGTVLTGAHSKLLGMKEGSLCCHS